jgi:hypothetical protein
MFERYTEKARRVIFFARDEASELGAHGLTTLARANGRAARVDAAISRDPRAYDLELRGVTATEALQVPCLVTHLHVRDDGEVLDFTLDTGRQ